MMVFITSILGVGATIISIANGYGAYCDYLINKQKYINEMVADSIDYSYNFYVKPNKLEWDNLKKKEALNIAKSYFRENSLYYVNDVRLNRIIEIRLLEIKSLKMMGQINLSGTLLTCYNCK